MALDRRFLWEGDPRVIWMDKLVRTLFYLRGRVLVVFLMLYIAESYTHVLQDLNVSLFVLQVMSLAKSCSPVS
jgi:hypothetical protein